MTDAIITTTTVQAVKPTRTPAPAPTAPVASVPARPHTIVITERTMLAFATAAVHVRNGYIFSPDHAPEVYASQGQSSITLIIGNPNATAVEAATATTDHAVALQCAEFDRQVEQAAKLLVETAQRKAKQEVAAAEVAEAEKALRKLKAAAASI